MAARRDIYEQNRAEREYERDQIRAERVREDYGRRVAKNVFGYERR